MRLTPNQPATPEPKINSVTSTTPRCIIFTARTYELGARGLARVTNGKTSRKGDEMRRPSRVTNIEIASCTRHCLCRLACPRLRIYKGVPAAIRTAIGMQGSHPLC
eukprot:3705752-Pleurochrysis_carterae.AAC.1